MSQSKSNRFSMDRLVMTNTINVTMVENGIFAREIKSALDRYASCDWGDITAGDKELNNEAVKSGNDRILAAFPTLEGRIYIITEYDRSYTTIMFCNEY